MMNLNALPNILLSAEYADDVFCDDRWSPLYVNRIIAGGKRCLYMQAGQSVVVVPIIFLKSEMDTFKPQQIEATFAIRLKIALDVLTDTARTQRRPENPLLEPLQPRVQHFATQEKAGHSDGRVGQPGTRPARNRQKTPR